MDAKRWAAVAGCAGAVALAAGCGSSSTASASSPTVTVTVTMTTATQSGAGTATGAQSGTATGAKTGTATGATGTSGGARNLVVTAALRTQLLTAGAAANSVPAGDYSGLAPGETYYAYDPSTGTHWAGARLVAKSSSIKAQVSVQDDGGYLLFTMPSGGSWRVYPVGMTGVGGSVCPVTVPSGVLRVWGWRPGTCRSGV